MPIFEIVALLLALAVGWLWLDSARAREVAVSACRRACAAEGLQFLDDTVAIARVGVERAEDGMLRLRRVYEFEYSDTGNNRRKASVVMLGHRVVVLNLALPAPSNVYTLH